MTHLNEAVRYLKLSYSGTDGITNAAEYLNQFSNEDKYAILMASRYILAKIAVDNGKNMMDACYECKYRDSVPGDSHSCCRNKLAVVIGDEHGVKNGWFFHPFNFDPVWLRYCDGFEKDLST